jgi:hypothetical protein
MVASESWAMLTRSLERALAAAPEGLALRGLASATPRERRLLTLLAMPALGLFKPCDLTPYSGTALGLVTGRERPYSADEMEHAILSFVRLGWTEPLTADVARWATQLWAPATSPDETTPAYCYWDWHVKAVYSDYWIPRTKHGTQRRIVGARKQLLLHDAAGHLLFLRTYRGDTHLIDGMVDGTAYYEGQVQAAQLTRQVFDREGLAVAHFKALAAAVPPRQFITCLRANQYTGVDSFATPTTFEPYRYDQDGQVIQEIAAARYNMPDRRAREDSLPLRAVLLRTVADSSTAESEAHLLAIVTSDWDTPVAAIADQYRARQSRQENAIRDWWLPLGGDVNVGYVKHPVENSELAKRQGELVARLARLERYIPACDARLERLQRRHQKLAAPYQAAWEVAQQALAATLQQRAASETAVWDLYQWAQAEETRLREELQPLRTPLEAVEVKNAQEQAKQQRYRAEQQQKQQTLTEISQQMTTQPMYELDDRKDQLLSALRLSLVNVLQWLRDTVFPASYARATYQTLQPFVQMGGFVTTHPQHIEVHLDGFWQAAKQRDLEVVVAQCNAQQFTAPDGRPLRFSICAKPGHI